MSKMKRLKFLNVRNRVNITITIIAIICIFLSIYEIKWLIEIVKYNKIFGVIGYALLTISLSRTLIYRYSINYNKRGFEIRLGWNVFKEKIIKFSDIDDHRIEDKIITLNVDDKEKVFDLSGFNEDDVLKFYGIISLYTSKVA